MPAVITLDKAGCFTHVDELAQRHFGLKEPELLGHSIFDYSDERILLEPLISIKPGKYWVGRIPIRHNGNLTYLPIKINAMSSNDKVSGYVISIEDVQLDDPNMEEQLLEIYIGSFLNKIHNKMQALQLSTEINCRPINSSCENHKRIIDVAASEIEVMCDYLKINSTRSNEIFDLGTRVNNDMRIFSEYLAKYRITAKTEMSDEEVMVHTQKRAIDKILINIVMNAQNVMPQGGSLHIQTSSRYYGAEWFENEALGTTAKEGTYGVMVIQDTGIGIEEKHKVEIFKPFHEFSSMYHTVKTQSGFVLLDSSLGKGSKITIGLPLAKAS